jgi:hypothetical protein
MAFSPQGGTVTPPSTPLDLTKPNNLADLLIAAGALFEGSPKDQGYAEHYTYHTLAMRAAAGNSGTINWGFGRADGAALSTSNAAGYLAKGESFTIDCVNGVGALESVQVIGNGSDTLLVTFVE